MKLLLVAATVRSVCKGFITKRALVRPQPGVQYQVCLQCLGALVLVATLLAFELFLIRMHNHMHVEGTLGVKLQATVRTHVQRIVVSIFVCLRDGKGKV